MIMRGSFKSSPTVAIYFTFCLILIRSWLGSCQEVYTCPGLTEDPVVVPGESSSKISFTRRINKSKDGTVCILIKVVPKHSGVDMTRPITRQSHNADYNIIPIARSYNNRNWERVAGPYAQELITNSCCTVVIPTKLRSKQRYKNKSSDNEGKLILMSFKHQLSKKEEVSRFFQHTTFGPTMSMINSWDYGSSSTDNDMQVQMANWLHDQMDEKVTNPTSHREYYRKRLDFSTIYEDMMKGDVYETVRPRHPCEQYARWRRFAFTRDDFLVKNAKLTVSTWNGQILLSFNGIPRTVVSNFRDRDGATINPGDYGLCKDSIEEVVNGKLGLRDQKSTNRNLELEEEDLELEEDPNGRKIPKDCIVTYNPVVNLPNGVITDDIRVVSLPDRSEFGSIEEILLQEEQELFFGAAYYLKNDISRAGCNDIPANGKYRSILGTFSSGEQGWYGGHIVLDENTLEKPIADAGSTMAKIAKLQGIDPYDKKYSMCPVASKSFLNADSCYLSTTANACSSVYKKLNDGDAVVVCGSPGEVANGPLSRNTFSYYDSNNVNRKWESQKKHIWSMIALDSEDQLRQRVAWALSQILVVSPKEIGAEHYTEMYLNYYDIFVRNAFGNYFDILKEVSYSPVMAEMLSYENSKSSAYVLEDSGGRAFPDENYAREIMQLFTIGVYELNMDGTKKLDSSGSPISTYENSDIQNFARAWTGFVRQIRRSNIEMRWRDGKNRIDPMKIQGIYRDSFPKTSLHNGFIGDKVPLCVDLPKRHFLKKGATYRLLGSRKTPEIHEYPIDWEEDKMDNSVFVLNSSSNLKGHLSTGATVITLDDDISCIGDECKVDTMRLILVDTNPSIYYEYMRPPCVDLSFYDNGIKVSTRPYEDLRKSMCANPNVEAAYDVCCKDPTDTKAVPVCYYDLEKTTYATARSNCQTAFPQGDTCDHYRIKLSSTCKTKTYTKRAGENHWWWTNQDCDVKVKVGEDGNVAIAHEPANMEDSKWAYTIDLRVHPDNTNYFKVYWDDGVFPNSSNLCGNGACFAVYRACYCSVDIKESSVFNSLPTESQVLERLQIGAFDPSILDTYSIAYKSDKIQVWHKNGGYDEHTIFGVSYRGKEIFLKNAESIVKIRGASQFSFRNPPSFISMSLHEPRDAMYETDAVLENYFFHDNVAPFLAHRIIQRFGVSNPSPRYVEAVAKAFKSGTFSHPDPSQDDFGDGRYGSLEAMIAAVILDPEIRSVVLDADPTSGSLIEPMIKLTRFMRAMEFQKREEAGDRVRLVDLKSKIGQEPHSSETVFSFFLPEYAAPGQIKAASLVSPEAQVMSGPTVTSILNGFISLVDLGLTECYSGFGEFSIQRCKKLEDSVDTSNGKYARGELKFTPSNPSDASSVVDELSMLLTAGRLSSASRDLIINAFKSASSNSSGTDMVKKLITSTPEYHSTNVAQSTLNERPELKTSEPAGEKYKAIVFLMLGGGIDSFNILVPHSGCSGGDMSYDHYNITRGAISVPQEELHQIDVSSSSQVCDTFGIHPNLPYLKTLYDDEELLWIANMGMLQEPVSKADWKDKTKLLELFAHNFQQDDVKRLDILKLENGGVGGRILDVLVKNGLSAETISVDGIADALVSTLGSMVVLEPRRGVEELNPIPWADPLLGKVKHLNNATSIGSGLFSETWSNTLFQSLGENDIFYEALKTAKLSTAFPSNSLGKELAMVAQAIQTKSVRGRDRDVFYTQIGGFDTHSNIKERLDGNTIEINSALEAFTKEMRSQGAWNDITIVMVSEFGRTLPGNTGMGSDHAWGGHYFIAGGDVDGKRMLGTYPETFSYEGPLVFEPGIVIPTQSWDTLWNGVAQWFGITDPDDLDEVLPNRKKFSKTLFHANDLYVSTIPTQSPTVTSSPTQPTTQPPTIPPTRSPTSSPVDTSTTSPSTAPTDTPPSACFDSPVRFRIVKPDGTYIWRDCFWVKTRSTNLRCSWGDVSSICPVTCNSCDPCRDATGRFRVDYNGKNIARDCGWVANKATIYRCKFFGVTESCRETCGLCRSRSKSRQHIFGINPLNNF